MIYEPNATEADRGFVIATTELQNAGIEVKPLPGNVNRFETVEGIYSVKSNGDVVRIDANGIFYVGRI